MERLQTISSHFASSQILISKKDGKCPDDVVICSALRTCLSKAKRGPLRDTAQEVMLAEVLKEILKQTKVDPSLVSDLIVGNVLQPGAGAVQARAAQLIAGFPHTTTAVAINRLCSSGIEAISMVASKIKSGTIDIGIGAGTESMTQYSLPEGRYPKLDDEMFTCADVKSAYIPDGMTSENVVKKFGMTRKELDEYACNSHLKAAHARKTGLFKSEIVPIKAKVKGKDGKEEIELAHEDGGIRANSTVEALGKLKPAFQKNGWTTGGSSSQLTDGAAAVLLARRSVAEKLGLPILAKFVTYATAGCPPEIMGKFSFVFIKKRRRAGLCYSRMFEKGRFECE